MISEKKRKIGFWFKIKVLFQYGATNWKFYKQDISKIITTFQAMYYHAKKNELSEEITDMEKYLHSVNKDILEDLCKQSMVILKDKLARKYEGKSSRTIFSEDDLRKRAEDVLAEYPVILSTTFSSRNSLSFDVVYDYLIMDEASQVDIVTGALALSCAKNVVIVGDTKQLPNIVTDAIKFKAKAIFDTFNLNEGYQYTKSFLQSVLEVIPNVTQILIYSRICKKPVLAIEVDGYEYHKEDTVQDSRDLLKNRIMELYEIPLLRFKTNGSGEREKIIEILENVVE